jgi:hypothetical protein
MLEGTVITRASERISIYYCRNVFRHVQQPYFSAYVYKFTKRGFFFVEKGPAADATNAPQPLRLIVQHYDEDEEKDD